MNESAATAPSSSACTELDTYTVHGCAHAPPVHATTGMPREWAYHASIAERASARSGPVRLPADHAVNELATTRPSGVTTPILMLSALSELDERLAGASHDGVKAHTLVRDIRAALARVIDEANALSDEV